jgi:hypothetical protein
MMTAEELERLVATCARADCPVLIALSATGRVEFTPPEQFDQSVTDAFSAHQRRTTSAGKLLGPDAVGAAVDGFIRLGLEVRVRAHADGTHRLGGVGDVRDRGRGSAAARLLRRR